ncbi:SDR family oxidoreductase [Candidatus Uabimicrobium amorphum]
MVKDKKSVLIAGSTGYLGKHLVKAFSQSGYHVIALARNPGKLDSLADLIDKTIVIDPTNKSSLKGQMKNIDYVISALGITKQKDNLGYWDVDFLANKNILEEAIVSGVSRFAYVHVLEADRIKGDMVTAKSAFVKLLRHSPIDSTIICPSGFFSDMCEFLNMGKSGRIYLFGNGEPKLNPIHGEDLAIEIERAVANKIDWLDIGGPEIFTQNEIAQLAFSVLGKPVIIVNIPFCFAKIIILLAKLLGFRRKIGPLEFFASAFSGDMCATKFGNHHLKVFFQEQLP